MAALGLNQLPKKVPEGDISIPLHFQSILNPGRLQLLKALPWWEEEGPA